MIHRKLARAGIAAVLAAGLFGAAAAQAPAKTKATKPKTTKPKPAAAKPSAPKSIAEIALGNPDFSTLVTAVSAAGLVDTLKAPGQFTVFAPTNAAFAKVPKATLDGLLADKKALTDVLTYHVIAGKVAAADVVKLDGKSAKTLNGAEIKIAVKDGKVILNDSVMVTTTDIMASNGIIHVIDAVLLPPAPAAPAAAPAPATPAAKSIAEIAVGNKDFSTLVTALSTAGLVDTFKGPGPFTVFAPTNDAFAKIPAATLNGLLADKKALTDVLTYHVVSGKVTAADVVKLDGKSAKTLNGAEVKIGVSGGKVMLNGNVMVVATDIMASNGVIHVIDTVLLPPAASATPAAPAAAPAAGTIAAVASNDPRFSTLVTAVKAAGLVDTLNGPGPFTVFAPTNTAFELLGKDVVANLLKPENKKALTDVLLYHVVPGKVLAADVVKLHSAKTALGKEVRVTKAYGNVYINNAQILITDIQTSNGVIHVIDSVLVP